MLAEQILRWKENGQTSILELQAASDQPHSHHLLLGKRPCCATMPSTYIFHNEKLPMKLSLADELELRFDKKDDHDAHNCGFTDPTDPNIMNTARRL